jgi:uncharacterized protein YjbI with pentapeptide repeats
MPTTAADGRRSLSRPVARLVMLGVIGWLALALASVFIFPGLLHPLLPVSELQRLNLDQQLQRQQEQRRLQNEARAALIQGLVGLLALSGAAIGASVAWRQLQDNRRHQQHNEKLSQKQLELSREQLRQALDTSQEELRLTREGQVTERFTRAIDQLGNDKLSVTLGGIYALERIARDSPPDRAAIADILSAYIRKRLPASDHEGYVEPLPLRAPDAQAALTVLGRSPLCDERVALPEAGHLDLSRTDLRRANLQGARLERVNLWNARLQGADLRGAHLEGSILESANFGPFEPNSKRFQHGADLRDANLTGAQLGGAINLKAALTEGTIGLPP